jgi:transposase
MLSSRGYSVDRIADIYEVDRDTVGRWLDDREEDGATGLHDQPGRGRKPILTEKEQKLAISLVEKDPRSSKRSLIRLEEKTGGKISRGTLKRILRQGRKTWKRLRRSLRGKRDEVDFQAAKAELGGFRAQAGAGGIDFSWSDGAGFTLDPCVPCLPTGRPHAWQTPGGTSEIPAASGDRINVLGFSGSVRRTGSARFLCFPTTGVQPGIQLDRNPLAPDQVPLVTIEGLRIIETPDEIAYPSPNGCRFKMPD